MGKADSTATAGPARPVRAALFVIGAAFGALLVAMAWLFHPLYKSTKVYVLDAPMVLSTDATSAHVHLLPKGTTLYFDDAFAEGFERYRVYVDIDRTPLVLKELDDPTRIAPIRARMMEDDDLQRAPHKPVLSKQELRAILGSGSMTRDEIEALFDDVLQRRQ